MKKVLIIILTIGFIFTSGCAKPNGIPNISSQDSNANNLKPSTQDDLTANQTKITNAEAIENSFFFKNNVSQLNYKGKLSFDDGVEKKVKLNINKVADLKYGKLYELKLDSVEGVPNERLRLGYFYVQKDKIYKIESTAENLSKLKTSEELPNGSVIVCQDKEIKDSLSKDDPGFHHYLEVNEDKREYHSYNNQVATGYYESFTWEKNKGLIHYRSGYGAERDSIELQLSSDDISNDTLYKVTELKYSKSDTKMKCDIKYPEISGLSDNDKQKKINSTLKNEALKVLKYYENPYGSVELNIDYEIVLKNANILSIQYLGLGSVSNAAHPNSLFFTTNVNIKTGDRLRLKDIVNIDKNFANKFLNGEFKAVRPEQSEALKHFINEEIQQYFKEADSLDNIGTEKQSDVFSYFTNDTLGISISVGHAMGDHAEFEIKYSDIIDNIKTENEIWKDLLHASSERNNKK